MGLSGGVAPTGKAQLFPLALLSPARKAIDSLYTRFISGYQRVPADSKHHVLLFATVPHPDGLQREENAEQQCRHIIRYIWT